MCDLTSTLLQDQSSVAFRAEITHLLGFFSSIKPLISIRTINIQSPHINIQTKRIPFTPCTLHIYPLRHDITTRAITTTRKSGRLRRILLARLALKILEQDIRNRERRRIFEAEREVRLAVALVNFDGVVHVIDCYSIVRYVLHEARTASALEIAGERGGRVGPDFYAGAI